MKIPLMPKHLKRYKDIALLLIKYGRSDVVKQAGLQDALELDASVRQRRASQRQMNWRKTGEDGADLYQARSTSVHSQDFLPPAYIHALTRLQDKIEPFRLNRWKQSSLASWGYGSQSIFKI